MTSLYYIKTWNRDPWRTLVVYFYKHVYLVHAPMWEVALSKAGKFQIKPKHWQHRLLCLIITMTISIYNIKLSFYISAVCISLECMRSGDCIWPTYLNWYFHVWLLFSIYTYITSFFSNGMQFMSLLSFYFYLTLWIFD
jgi:hypothetical protein